jgi:hypothetical protein
MYTRIYVHESFGAVKNKNLLVVTQRLAVSFGPAHCTIV